MIGWSSAKSVLKGKATVEIGLPPFNNCRLPCLLLVILKVISANSVDPDDLGPHFASMQKIGLKCLQEYSADDINRRHFQMQFFLAL